MKKLIPWVFFFLLILPVGAFAGRSGPAGFGAASWTIYATSATVVPAAGVTAGTLGTDVLISTVPALDGSQLTGLTGANVTGTVPLATSAGTADDLVHSTGAADGYVWTSTGTDGVGEWSAEPVKRQISVTFSNGGEVLADGKQDIGLRVPYAMELEGWQIVSYPEESTATLKVDLWYSDFGTFPSASDTIVGSSTPSLTSVNYSSGTCAGFDTTVLVEGKTLEFSLQDVDVSTRAVVHFWGTVK